MAKKTVGASPAKLMGRKPTITGRMTGSEPAIQRIPRPKKVLEDRKLRSMAKMIPYGRHPLSGVAPIEAHQVAAMEAQADHLQRQLGIGVYSQQTQAFLDEQAEKAPGRAIEHITKVAEAELADKRAAAKAKAEVSYTPKPCKKCGSTTGCVHPREDVLDEPEECKHPFIVIIPHTVAMEIDDSWDLGPDDVVRACRECHEIVFVNEEYADTFEDGAPE